MRATDKSLTYIHLLRHGEVYNPNHVIYERLDNFHLSKRGLMMADQVALFVKSHPDLSKISKIYCSPLDRTLETAAPVANELGLKIVKDDRLLESKHFLAGKNPKVEIPKLLKSLRLLSVLKLIINPSKPSWGEPYADVASRMKSIINEVVQKNQGKHILLVSHQNPIWISRLFFEEKQLRHNPQKRVCDLASITSLAFTKDSNQLYKVMYRVPARNI